MIHSRQFQVQSTSDNAVYNPLLTIHCMISTIHGRRWWCLVQSHAIRISSYCFSRFSCWLLLLCNAVHDPWLTMPHIICQWVFCVWSVVDDWRPLPPSPFCWLLILCSPDPLHYLLIVVFNSYHFCCVGCRWCCDVVHALLLLLLLARFPSRRRRDET